MPERDELRIIGVMTGTSCDGLDASCLSITSNGWTPTWTASAPYPSRLRSRVLGAQKPGTRLTLKEFLELERDLGDWYAETIAKLLRGRTDRPHVIANHGQTVAHYPAAKGRGMSLQLGDPTRIARATGLTVVSNFRQGDIAAGGQGAPLVPLFHSMLAEALGVGAQGVAFHNLGGISNLTYVSPDGSFVSFDTGPGNVWIDAAAAQASRGKLPFDRGGRMAASGQVDTKLAAKWLSHPFFRQKPPKSTGRDDFPADRVAAVRAVRGADLVATATFVTVESIARAYERWILAEKLPLRTIFVCGGGARNSFLMARLAERLPNIRVQPLSELGLDPQAIESQAFAMLGYLALRGHPVGGAWTGAAGFGPPAHLIPGENWDEVLSLIGSHR